MITLVLFFVLLSAGLPIIFLLIFASFSFAIEAGAFSLLDSFAVQSVRGIEANGFLAIPLYMLVGEIMSRGGITERLVRTAMRLVGWLHGGLAFVNVLTNAFAAAILGSATAQIAVMTRSLVPEMVRHGYDKGFATGLTVATGLLGPIIPPSMLMIIYGVLAYQSVATLFIAGIIPGILVVIAFFIVVGLSRGKMPDQDGRIEIPMDLSSILADAAPAVIPAVIIAGVVSGAMTPTEAGAVACVVAGVLTALFYRSLSLRDWPNVFHSVVLSSASIVALIGFATLFGWVLSYESVPGALAQSIADMAVGQMSFLFLVCLVVFVLGMFLDGVGVMIVIVPVLLPLAQNFGVDPIHFGVVIALATLTGLVTPPVGPGLYLAMDATGLGMMQIVRSALPFLAVFILVIAIVVIFPSLSVWLPDALGL
jgi:tripartite ATP-independent transporter DctM subunit